MTSPLRATGDSWTSATVPTNLSVEVLEGPPTFVIAWTVRLDRLKKRKCAVCAKRRIVYALRGYAGSVVIASSPLLCARCAGLVR
jgi:hypothetical protein